MTSFNRLFKIFATACLSICLTKVSVPAVNAQENVATEPEIKMVKVSGFDMRVQTAGLEDRQADEPIVIFENGALAPLESWGTVISGVANFAPVIAYDRSTIGKSEWDGEPGTPTHVTENLRALLRNLSIDPPYIFVGWSWGGNLIRYHSDKYPNDTAGLVYIDPPVLSFSATLKSLESIGYGEEEYEAILKSRKAMFSNMPESARADVMPIYNIYKDREDPVFNNLPEVPTSVIIAGRYTLLFPEGEEPVDPKLYFEATFRNKVQHIGEWAISVPEGLLIVDRNSGHAVQLEQPDIVIEAIRRVVFPGIALQLRKALNNGGIQSLLNTYESLKRRYPAEMFGEEILNSFGYELLRMNDVKEAIAVFELNVKEYPGSSNLYDSLGDGFKAAGETGKAIENYKKSVELNPQSPSIEKLKELEKEN